MDDRLEFLHSSSPVKAQDQVLHHHQPLEGDVALQYWSRRDGSSQPPEQILLFILGNPGLLGYYPPFLNHLHSLLPPSCAILSSSHIGHSPHLAAPSTPLTLPQQLESKVELVEVLEAHLAAWAKKEDVPRPKVHLIGHSVGAWLSCEVAKRIPQQVDAVFILFPTVGWIAETWNGRTLWPIFSWPFRQLLPFLSPLLRPVLPLTWFPPTTLSLLRSPRTIRHCLDLSVSEMETIRQPDFEWFATQVNRLPGRSKRTKQDEQELRVSGVYGIWSAGTLDGWVGREGQLVRDAIGGEKGGRVRVLDKVPHAFCLTQRNSELVAEALASWLVPGLVQPHDLADQNGELPALANKLPM